MTPISRKLGFAVKVLGAGGLPSHDTRRWQSNPHLSVSLERLEAILAYCAQQDIRMYRFTSDLIPYGTHPEMPQFHRQLEECAQQLSAVGALAERHDVRLSSHPGQYIVLNSEREEVRSAARRDLDLQGELLDALGAGPEAVVVIHVGAAGLDKLKAIERFVREFDKLSDAGRRRLVIENDDRSFSLSDVLRVSERTGAPVVWDIHHHHCHDPDDIPDDEALGLALKTWPSGVKPKVHYSSPKTSIEEKKKKVGRRIERSIQLPQLRAHADLIDPIGFEHFIRHVALDRPFDIMLEAKAKDLALIRLRDQLGERGFGWEDGSLIA